MINIGIKLFSDLVNLIYSFEHSRGSPFELAHVNDAHSVADLIPITIRYDKNDLMAARR